MVSEHKAIIDWKRTGPNDLRGRYSRDHIRTFDAGITVEAARSPSIVMEPYSSEENTKA